MIHLTRNRQQIASGLIGETRLKRELVLLRGKHTGELEALGAKFWQGKAYWKEGKATLRADSHHKCAYCEAPASIVTFGDVDHFRPKTIYWWLAYCYDNHVYSCQICKEFYKRENFPISGTRLSPPDVGHALSVAELEALVGKLAPDPVDPAAVMAFLAQLATESSDLLNPYDSSPEEFFMWSADEALKEVLIQPRSDSDIHQRVFNAVKLFYGLNREELRRARWSLVYMPLAALKDDMDTFSEHARFAEDRETAAKIKEMTQDDKPFAGMARYFVHVQWRLEL